MTNDFPILLFDLGGVVVETHGIQTLLPITGDATIGQDLVKARQKWENTQVVGQFERGQISVDVFCDGFIEEWQLDMDRNEFMDMFNGFVGDFFPGGQELLKQLKTSGYELSCLSNTNALHWKKLQDTLDIDQYFNHSFASFEIGERKPQEVAFQHAIDILGVSPESIMYFDDNLPNVKAAQDCGMNAFETKGFEALESVLRCQLGFSLSSKGTDSDYTPF